MYYTASTVLLPSNKWIFNENVCSFGGLQEGGQGSCTDQRSGESLLEFCVCVKSVGWAGLKYSLASTSVQKEECKAP